MAEILHQPSDGQRLGDLLSQELQEARWTEFRAAVAFVKRSGTRHLREHVRRFAARATVQMSVGISCKGSSEEGLRDLIDAIEGRGTLVVVHNPIGGIATTFHPKVYLFSNDETALLILGSGNLTSGGLFTNYEASVVHSLALHENADRELFESTCRILDDWLDINSPIVQRLSADLLTTLVDHGLVPPEQRAASDVDTEASLGPSNRNAASEAGFASAPILPPPRIATGAHHEDAEVDTADVPPQVPATNPVFLMTLQRTDVGVGQTSTGTSRRSPEVFIPLAARDHDPQFWGWPAEFRPDPNKPGKMDRSGVRMLLGGRTIHVNMMTWPDKHDFRLRCEELRSAGSIGDILRIEKVDQPALEYYVEIIPNGSSRHGQLAPYCNTPVRNSLKEWRYI